MKYVLGALALAAAIIIVGCSATTLFLTAFNSVQEPWQQWLQGAGIAAIVAWEAAAVLVIGYCFRTRYWATGLGALVLLVLSMAVTSRQELRLYLGGAADMAAAKTVKADDRIRVRAELERAYSRRDQLQAQAKLSKYQIDELGEVKGRIAKLEARWDTQTVDVYASGNKEGELANKLLGFDADLAQLLLDTLPLWFWMVARVFSIPAAAVAIQAMRSEKPKEASRQPEGIEPAAVATIVAPVSPAASVEPYASDEDIASLRRVIADMKAAEVKVPETAVEPVSIPYKSVNPSENPMGSEAGASTTCTPPSEIGTNSPNLGREVEKVERPLESPALSPDFEDVIDTAENVTKLFRDANPKASFKIRREETTVTRWMRDRTKATDGKGYGSRDLHPDYRRYCLDRGEEPLPKRKFATLLRGELGLPKLRDEDGRRSGAVIMFPIELAPLTMRKTA